MTPLRSMRKRLMLQLPLLMALSMPWLMISARRFLPASKADALFAFDSVVSACSQCNHPNTQMQSIKDPRSQESPEQSPSCTYWGDERNSDSASSLLMRYALTGRSSHVWNSFMCLTMSSKGSASRAPPAWDILMLRKHDVKALSAHCAFELHVHAL